MSYVLAVDQGTTSTRALIYDNAGQCVGTAGKEFKQHYPQPGWVEHDLEEIWQSVAEVVPQAISAARIEPGQIVAIGVTNQRETTAIWDRSTGRPIARAIVWQDRRTTEFCRERRTDEPWLQQKSGLVLDPYFSATKIRWLLENAEGARQKAETGKLAAGTIDCFLLWRLTGGKSHATDVSNASRTLLLNLQKADWDDELCGFFAVPRPLLPEIKPSAADFGKTSGCGFLPDGIPVCGMAGDQQASLFGQGGFSAGDAKCTYGTGAFFLQHLGDKPTISRHRLVTSLAATTDSKPQYALEGSLFVAGAAVQWLRDSMSFIESSSQVEELAKQSDLQQPLWFVPAFVGLGAPHWVPEARGVMFGLTRSTSPADIARATLEGVALQVADLIQTADLDCTVPIRDLRVDGGMARNSWFLQRQTDLLGIPVLQSESESTALGAAFLAGLQAGLWPDPAALRSLIHAPTRFEPKLKEEDRTQRLAAWQKAVQAVISFYA